MAYCRWGDSDVYAYMASDGVTVHLSANGHAVVGGGPRDWTALSALDAAALLRDLQKRGADVPDDAIDDLLSDATDAGAAKGGGE